MNSGDEPEEELPDEVVDGDVEEGLDDIDPEDLARLVERPFAKLAKLQGEILREHLAFKVPEQQWMKDLAQRMDVRGRWSAALGPVIQVPSFPPDFFAKVLPQLDLPKFAFPQLDLGQLDALRQIADRFDYLTRLPAVTVPHDWFPETWEDLSDEEVDAAMAIIREEGVPLVWVARQEIVLELVRAADMDARDAILLARRQEIAQDCLEALGQVTNPDFKDLVDAAIEAVEALNLGLTRNAQSLAASVFDTALREVVRRGVLFQGEQVYFTYKKIRNKIVPVSADTSIGEFRAACVFTPVILALTPFDPGDPTPARFNRHSTAHHLNQISYCPENAIVAVMLTASFLREAEASSW